MSALNDLTDWLATRTPQQMATLLAARPGVNPGRTDDLEALAQAVRDDQYGCRALHALTMAEHDVLGAAVSLAEGPDAPHPAKASRYAPMTGYRGGHSTIIQIAHLVAAVAGSARPDLADHAHRVIDSLVDRLLLWPAGPDRIRVPVLIRNCTGPRPAAPTLERALTGGYAKEPVQQIAALLLLDRYPPTGPDPAPRGGPTREQIQHDVIAVLADPDRVRAITANAPLQTNSLLSDLLAGPLEIQISSSGLADRSAPLGRQLPEAARWLAERALLVPSGRGRARLPREVAAALGGAAYRFDPLPAIPATRQLPPERISGEAHLAATHALAMVELLGATLTARPATIRRDRALATREVKRLATAMKIPLPQVRFWIELARAAHLLAVDPGPPPASLGRGGSAQRGRSGSATPSSVEEGTLTGPTLVPSARYHAWAQHSPAARLTPLIIAWAAFPGSITWYPSDKDVPAVLAAVEDRCAAGLRRAVLACLANLPPGTGLADPPDPPDSAGTRPAGRPLAWTVRWQRPECIGDRSAEEIAATLAEAQMLGLVALGALTRPGRILHDHLPGGDCADQLSPATATALTEELLEAFTPLLPAPHQQAHFQTDLTALVPGLASADLTALLDEAADRENHHGQAGIWRFSQASLRRALDAGADADDLLHRLRQAAHNPLPQALEYLIADAARRHGHLEVVPAGCVLRCADVGLAAEVTRSAHRALKPLDLQLVAPTVIVSAQPPAVTLRALRSAGYAPVLTDASAIAMLPAASRPTASGHP
ncbi:helicase-associated domain-containing protein [Nonomuraea sp. NPDC050536]|uniref:helicase-associated domain-containing protein n=1 Tax=Nonomuraea sp. NPDC050536 TaxID=3364366 RepID=UPI0037C9D297